MPMRFITLVFVLVGSAVPAFGQDVGAIAAYLSKHTYKNLFWSGGLYDDGKYSTCLPHQPGTVGCQRVGLESQHIKLGTAYCTLEINSSVVNPKNKKMIWVKQSVVDLSKVAPRSINVKRAAVRFRMKRGHSIRYEITTARGFFTNDTDLGDIADPSALYKWRPKKRNNAARRRAKYRGPGGTVLRNMYKGFQVLVSVCQK